MSVLKYKNPNWVEGSGQPKWIAVGSGGSSGGNGDTGGNGGDGGNEGGSGGSGETKKYETVNVSISADNGASITADVTVNGETKSVTSGSSVPWEVEYGTEYIIEVADVNGYAKPETLTFTAEQSIRNITLMYSYAGAFITKIRIDDAVSDPATKVTKLVDENGVEKIKENSHRYVGKLNSDGVIELKQLDDKDGTKYTDGSSADLSGLEGDVFMKLPQFYYKAEQYSDNVWDIYFAYQQKPDDSYKEWDGKDLIGVYKGSVSEGKLYSVSGKSSSIITSSEASTIASSRGTGYSLVRYEHHCIMAYLYLAMYCHTNSQLMIGVGRSDQSLPSGGTDYLSMEDTAGDGGNGDSHAINFWGLENWWGNRYELMDNISTNGNEFVTTMKDGTERTFGGYFGADSGTIGFLKTSEFLDAVARQTYSNGSLYYTDEYYADEAAGRRYVRSGYRTSSESGIFYFHESFGLSGQYGTRLAYRGEYIINE